MQNVVNDKYDQQSVDQVGPKFNCSNEVCFQRWRDIGHFVEEGVKVQLLSLLSLTAMTLIRDFQLRSESKMIPRYLM